MSSKYTSLGGSFSGGVSRVTALVCGVALALVLFAVLANPAKAETFTVNSTADPGDGTCDATECTLREAIDAANGNNESDTITFDVPDNSTITLTRGRLTIANDLAGPDLTIDGTTANNLTVSVGNTSTVFRIDSGAESEIAGLTVRDGSAIVGGGIDNDGTLTVTNSIISGNSAGDDGGGIYHRGTLTVNGSTISGNSAGDDGLGGGIFNNDSTLKLTNTTISDNTADEGGGIYNYFRGTITINDSTFSDNDARNGGGIRNNTSATLTINDSTFSGNDAAIFGGGILNAGGTATLTNTTVSGNEAVVGGGIYNFASGRLTVNNSTINGNSADSGGGGIDINSGTADIENTIVANSTGDNCSGSINSQGSNLEDVNTCGFDQPSDQPNTNPLLRDLRDNGGPTQTHALQAGSLAIDGVVEGCPPPDTDQRGVARPQGEACDIGSFESRDSAAGITPPAEDFGNQKEGTTSAPETFTVKNTGNAPLFVSSTSIEGPDPAAFLIPNDNCEGETLAAGDTCTVEVVFSPDSTGAKSAVLRVWNDAPTGPVEAQLEGNGTAPDVSLTPTAHDFGNQQEGTISSPQTFTVENTGDAELDVGTVDIQGADSGAFTEQNDQCEGSTVASGESCTVEVVFSPDSTGAKSAVLRVQSDTSSGSDAPTSSEASTGFDEVQLSGSGTAIPVPPPVIDVPIVDTPPIRPPSIKPPATNIKPPKNNACTIRGNNKDNVLKGTPKRDVICGFGGNDRIRGLGGNDIIKGGAGHDIIYGNKGNDKLFGQRGNDALFGGKGKDVLIGGRGKNALVGGKGKDVERGGVAPADTKKQTKKLTKKVIKDIFKQVGVR